MKDLNNYILEKLKINKDSKIIYKYHPKDKTELKRVIKKCIYERGENANLNDIDVSNITDMSNLFEDLDSNIINNINISEWDVSNVTNMESMFNGCIKFNSDLSGWNVSKVQDFHSTFYRCKNFNSDLSKWNVENLKEASGAFIGCEKLDFNIDAWNPKNLYEATMINMFQESGFKKLPKWYKKYK